MALSKDYVRTTGHYAQESQSITEQLFGGKDFAKMVDDLYKANRSVSKVVANPNHNREIWIRCFFKERCSQVRGFFMGARREGPSSKHCAAGTRPAILIPTK